MDMKKLESCIQIMRRLPTNKLEQNINAITNLIYEEDDLLNAFLQKIEHPLNVIEEDGNFIACEYNRDGDSYRSPISNNYFPEMSDGKLSLKELRDLEVKLNKMFLNYTRAYFSNLATSSVYVYELNDTVEQGFVVVVLIKNIVGDEKKLTSGLWESTNFITVNYSKGEEKTYNVDYQLTSTIQLNMAFDHKVCGHVSLSGNVTKQTRQTHPCNDLMDEQFHVQNIGTMVEEMEGVLRERLEVIYVNKTKQIIDTARYNPTEGKPNVELANKLRVVMLNK